MIRKLFISSLLISVCLLSVNCGGSSGNHFTLSNEQVNEYVEEYADWILADNISVMERQRRLIDIKSRIDALQQHDPATAEAIKKTLERELSTRGHALATIDF